MVSPPYQHYHHTPTNTKIITANTNTITTTILLDVLILLGWYMLRC